MHLKILTMNETHAECGTVMSKPLSVRRGLLPRKAKVGQCFVLSVTEKRDGFTVRRITSAEYRAHERKIERIREGRRAAK